MEYSLKPRLFKEKRHTNTGLETHEFIPFYATNEPKIQKHLK
jgi:hypothetical protein